MKALMTSALAPLLQPAKIHSRQPADPLLANQAFALHRIFYPLGFPVEIRTNAEEILTAAEESWGEQTILAVPAQLSGTLRVRIGATHSDKDACPPATSVRASGHLLSIIADAENFAVCDLEEGTAFGWINDATLQHRAYLRFHFLEAIVMCLLIGSRLTPIHAACVSLNGCGLLLCGESGAGKSTLAYACARAGFTYTTDDASYVVWHSATAQVRGNAHQLRFRPAAREFFPELHHRSLTPRTEGKPSIEVRTAELPIRTAAKAAVHAVIFLERKHDARPELLPLAAEQMLPYLEASLLPLQWTHARQAAALDVFRGIDAFTFRYNNLDDAVLCLTRLTRRFENPLLCRQSHDKPRTSL